MIIWIRPSGRKLTTNDSKATIAHAESSGWVREGQESDQEKPKRKRRTKAEMEAAKLEV